MQGLSDPGVNLGLNDKVHAHSGSTCARLSPRTPRSVPCTRVRTRGPVGALGPSCPHRSCQRWWAGGATAWQEQREPPNKVPAPR